MQISFSPQIDTLIKKLMPKLNYQRQFMQYVAELRLNKGLWTPFLFYSPRHCEMQAKQMHKKSMILELKARILGGNGERMDVRMQILEPSLHSVVYGPSSSL